VAPMVAAQADAEAENASVITPRTSRIVRKSSRRCKGGGTRAVGSSRCFKLLLLKKEWQKTPKSRQMSEGASTRASAMANGSLVCMRSPKLITSPEAVKKLLKVRSEVVENAGGWIASWFLFRDKRRVGSGYLEANRKPWSSWCKRFERSCWARRHRGPSTPRYALRTG